MPSMTPSSVLCQESAWLQPWRPPGLKAPVGLGPYKFVSYTPGGDLVLEAYEGYWRKVPNIKRLIIKSVPEGTTRLAMLKTGEADMAFALEGHVAEAVQRDPNFTLVYT